MPKREFDRDGFPIIKGLEEAPQLRDGFGRTQMTTNPRIEGVVRAPLSIAEYRDPSLETFRRGISHWQRFNSIFRQVAALKRKWPARTAPELLTNLLLNKRQLSFQEQLAVMGGKQSLGGGVIDFFLPDRGLALNIHGRYYHTADARTEWLGLIGQHVMGMKIDAYRYIFDDDLYRYEDGRALDYTLVGMQL